ncbi:GNAT family N-acetyltransferase [Streptomyces sp. JV176]|uniref:GNAT family N-acetyltransferase n=1 Tax=Streptomyces sp. JV176 TaxID=858630 RepID=UPI002E78707C|nr:GNAT family N-acetyltransferase [Streptomyces sp. JV176]MEE1802833.1 GNAT family N-acetyltransferase [Streptomyces sp. JV176]
MTWQLTHDVEEFRAQADPYLAADAARHTILLTVSESLRTGGVAYAGPVRFGWWRETAEAPVTGAFLETPPHPPFLGTMPARAAAELARTLGGTPEGHGTPLSGVRGRVADVEAFGAAWTARRPGAGTGAGNAPPYRLSDGMRLFRLGEPTPPDPAPEGRARYAAAQDIPLAVEWLTAFAEEIGDPPARDRRALAVVRIEERRLLLWEVDGVPVSLAGHAPLIAGQIRVAPVYTPPAHRGRGYAAGVTAAVGETALRKGAEEVLLFADNANPTANALYHRLGYRPMEVYATAELA